MASDREGLILERKLYEIGSIGGVRLYASSDSRQAAEIICRLFKVWSGSMGDFIAADVQEATEIIWRPIEDSAYRDEVN